MSDNIIPIKKEEVFSVKIFFINPIELLDVIINTLLKIEYETYHVSENNKFKLLKIINNYKRSIIFFCIRNRSEIPKWMEYVIEIKKINNIHIQLGCFYYDYMDINNIKNFLKDGISMISFADIKNDTLQVMKKILSYFEAKGVRKFIRTKAYGVSEAYIYVKNAKEPVVGEILDVSSHAFSCRIIDTRFNNYYKMSNYFHDVLLILKGIRLKVDINVAGFSKIDPTIYIFKLCNQEIKNGKFIYTDNIPNEILFKLHIYIKECLREAMHHKLTDIEDDEQNKIKEKTEKKAIVKDKEKQGKKIKKNLKEEMKNSREKDFENSEVENEVANNNG